MGIGFPEVVMILVIIVLIFGAAGCRRLGGGSARVFAISRKACEREPTRTNPRSRPAPPPFSASPVPGRGTGAVEWQTCG